MARHPPAPRPRHGGAKAPAQRYIRVGCFYKMRNMVEWMEKGRGIAQVMAPRRNRSGARGAFGEGRQGSASLPLRFHA